jgi:cell division protein FtsB
MPLFFKGMLCVQILLLGSLQGYLWFSQRSLPAVWEAQGQVMSLDAHNAELQRRNSALIREIHDLKTGQAVEERARLDLGMIKPEESFFVIIESP